MELDYSIHGYPGHRGYPHFSTYISIICIEATYTWSEIYVVLYALLKWDLSVPFFVLFIQISFLSLLRYLVLLVHRIQATSVFLEHWLDIHLTRTLLPPQCTSSYQWNRFYRNTTNSNMVENIHSHLLTFTDSSSETELEIVTLHISQCVQVKLQKNKILHVVTQFSTLTEYLQYICCLPFSSQQLPVGSAEDHLLQYLCFVAPISQGHSLPCIRDSFIYFKQHRRET